MRSRLVDMRHFFGPNTPRTHRAAPQFPPPPDRLILLALAVTGCSDIVGLDGSVTDVALAEQLWAAHGPASYSYVLHRSCFCVPDAVRPVRIVVDGGVVRSRTFIDNGRSVPESQHSWLPPVAGLFDVVRDALERDADSVVARFDSRTGAPVSISIDERFRVADDEFQLTVSRLRPR